MSSVQNTLKSALRLKVKDALLKLSVENKKLQSDAVTKTVICFETTFGFVFFF